MKKTQQYQPNAVAVAGMGTAVAVVLSMLGAYIPAFVGLLSFVIPLPIISITLTAGARWGILATVGTLILDAAFFGVFSTGFLCGVFCVLGVIFGICYRMKLHPVATLLAGAVGVALGFVAQVVFSVYVSGIDLSFFTSEQIDIFKEQALEILPQLYSGDTLTQVQQNLNEMLALSKKVFFSGMALAMVVISWMTMKLSQFVFTRMGIRGIPTLPDFDRWEMPMPLVFLFIICFAMDYFFPGDELLGLATLNVKAICQFAFMIQGASVVWWLPVRYPSFKTIRWIILAGTLVAPGIILYGLVEVGLFDILFRYRKRHNYQ